MQVYENRIKNILLKLYQGQHQKAIAELKEVEQDYLKQLDKQDYLAKIPSLRETEVFKLFIKAYYNLILAQGLNKNHLEEFWHYSDKYLNKAKEFKANDDLLLLDSSAIKDIFSYNLEILMQEVLDKKDFQQNKKDFANSFKTEVKKLYLKFKNIFSLKVYLQLLNEAVVEKIYLERQNYNRAANNQNIKLTIYLIEVYLKVNKKSQEDNQKIASLINLKAELIYFYGSDRKDRIIRAIKCLEQVLTLDNNNLFAQKRLKELNEQLLTKQQITRFNHDAIELIVALSSKLDLILEQVSEQKLYRELLKVYDQADLILGVFRLTKKEEAKFEFVAIDKLLEDVVLYFDELKKDCLKFKGEKKEVAVDKNYFFLAIYNLIKNSLEAYRRRKIKIDVKAIEIEFCYDSMTCKIADKAGGIKEELAKNNKLFNAYTTSKEDKGGLGLALVKLAIDLQGFTIDYRNTKEGTEFIIKLEEGDF